MDRFNADLVGVRPSKVERRGSLFAVLAFFFHKFVGLHQLLDHLFVGSLGDRHEALEDLDLPPEHGLIVFQMLYFLFQELKILFGGVVGYGEALF